MRDLNIPYPKFGVVENADQSGPVSRELGFPLLVRPSYVLGGQSMKIVINEEELEEHVVKILQDIPDNKILLDHFLDRAIEAEADAICDGRMFTSSASWSTSSRPGSTAATAMPCCRRSTCRPS